jgi:hypothetical protein
LSAGVRHQVKLLRSKATKGQLETASQYVSQIRRVQAEIWPLISPTLEEFFSGNCSLEGRLSESATVDLTSGALLSGKLGETVFWNVQTFDMISWMAMWLTFRSVCSMEDVVSLLCDCAEFGMDSLPEWAGFQPRQGLNFHLAVRRNAVKLLVLGQMMHVVVDADLSEAVLARMYRLTTHVMSVEALTDAQLNGMRLLFEHPIVVAPQSGIAESIVMAWQKAVDEPPAVSSLSSFDVLKIAPSEMALHLTRSDCALLWNISMSDFQGFCGLSPSKGKEEGSIFRLVERRFDRVVWILLSMICWSDSPNQLLPYWISVEEEMEKIGNLHGLMMLNSALCHYLIEGLKKSWATISVEQMRAHQRISALFHPGNNYKEYRACYKDRASALWKALFFGDGAKLAFFSLTMPILQRDVIIGNEMPTYLEQLKPGTLNYQKMRVLGESASMFYLARVSAGHFLAHNSKDAEADLELLNHLTSIPWTGDEELLMKVV